MDKTVYYDLMNVVEGFMALHYGCGSISTAPSKRWPSATMIMGDGIPIITYIPRINKEFCILQFQGIKEMPNDSRITYNLYEIKAMFIKLLIQKPEEIVIKTIDE